MHRCNVRQLLKIDSHGLFQYFAIMKFALSILIIVCAVDTSDAQIRSRRTDRQQLLPSNLPLPEVQQLEAGAVFASVQRGLAASSVTPFSGHFAGSVHLALPASERGQFSPNQASQILSKFFADHRTKSMRFENTATTVAAPFAFGTLVVDGRGRPDTLRVYVALTRVDTRWLISQLAVY